MVAARRFCTSRVYSLGTRMRNTISEFTTKVLPYGRALLPAYELHTTIQWCNEPTIARGPTPVSSPSWRSH